MKRLHKVRLLQGDEIPTQEELKVYDCVATFDGGDVYYMVVLARSHSMALKLACKELEEEFPDRPGHIQTNRAYLLKED